MRELSDDPFPVVVLSFGTDPSRRESPRLEEARRGCLNLVLEALDDRSASRLSCPWKKTSLKIDDGGRRQTFEREDVHFITRL